MSSNLDQSRSHSPVTPLGSKQAFEFDTRPDKIWLNPISMSQLKRAVLKKSKTVALNGRMYNITYGESYTSKVTGEVRECVKLKRVDGIPAPFGYISMKRILAFEFEGEDK